MIVENELKLFLKSDQICMKIAHDQDNVCFFTMGKDGTLIGIFFQV